jgi:hypothetical protein
MLSAAALKNASIGFPMTSAVTPLANCNKITNNPRNKYKSSLLAMQTPYELNVRQQENL